MAKSQRLTVFLLEEDVHEFADALSTVNSAVELPLSEVTGLDGKFYFERRKPRPAHWVSYIQPAVSGEIEGAITASSSALLLVRVADRMMALTFGHGRGLLNLERIERRFGLKVTLNRVDPTELRSLDTKTFEDMVVSRRTQMSRKAELPAFGVDIARDLLRAVTGKARDPDFASTLSGSDGLVISTKVDIEALGAKLAAILDAYHDNVYREHFGWIDHLTQVPPGETRQRLDDLLLADLRRGDTSRVHMAPPDPLPWDEVEGFTFKMTGTRGYVYEDLDLEKYLAELGDGKNNLTIELLCNRRVGIQYSRTGDVDRRWYIYECLVAEYSLDDELYVLTEGDWFQVSRSLVDRVDKFLASAVDSETSLPPATIGETESQYNRAVESARPDELLLLDLKIPRPDGATSGVEPCDLLSVGGELIHIKRRSQSATLSHLFAQGSVALRALREDEHYRRRVREAIVERAGNRPPEAWLALVPEDWPVGHAGKLKVTYGVIAPPREGNYGWLPFFSRLNLMQHAQAIRLVGAEVAVTRIDVSTQVRKGAPIADHHDVKTVK